MKFKIILLIYLIICLTFCSCRSDAPSAETTNTSSVTSSSEVTSSDKYSDIIGFIEENDYYNAYNEFQKLTEEQRKKEYNPSDTSKALEGVEKKLYKEKNYDKFVKKVNITTKNILNYFELYSKTNVTIDDGNKYAQINYFIKLKDGYTMAKLSMGYKTKISFEFSYTERGRYYTIDSKIDEVVLGMYTASDISQLSRRTAEYEIDTYYNYYVDHCIVPGTSYNYSDDYGDDYGKYMSVCEDFVFTDAKGILYLEID